MTADDVNEADTYDLARSYFDVRELDRCEWTLRMCTGAKATFLRAYARYLVSSPTTVTRLRTRLGPSR